MSNLLNQNDITDRTDEVSTDNSNLTVEETNTESKTDIVCDDPVEENSTIQQERTNYEVVFFARYYNGRPSVDEIINFFNNYGVVHHVNCPEGRNNAFIFMSSLSTTVEHRRTRTTINQIRNDMTPEIQFHITVASSNRPIHRRQSNQYHGGRGSYQRSWRNYNRTPRQNHNYNNSNQNNNNTENLESQYSRHNNGYNDQRRNGVRRWNGSRNFTYVPRHQNDSNQNINYNNQRISSPEPPRGKYQRNVHPGSDRSNSGLDRTNQRYQNTSVQVRDTSNGVRRNTLFLK